MHENGILHLSVVEPPDCHVGSGYSIHIYKDTNNKVHRLRKLFIGISRHDTDDAEIIIGHFLPLQCII